MFLANLMLKRPAWDANLGHYSGYGARDVGRCVHALSALHAIISANPSLAAIREKYAHPRFQAVSRIPGVPAALLGSHAPL